MVTTEPPSSPLLKIHDAAAYIQMSVSWMKQNPAAIPYVRIGRQRGGCAAISMPTSSAIRVTLKLYSGDVENGKKQQ